VREEGGVGTVKGIRIDQAAAADAGPGTDQDVLEQRNARDAAHAQRRRPEEAADVPRRGRKVGVGDTAAAFEHRHFVAFFGQAQRGDAAAEAGADHDPVVVESSVGRHNRAFPRLS
jgi:hypothetical protein